MSERKHGDLISREALIKKFLHAMCHNCGDPHKEYICGICQIGAAGNLIKSAPAVDAVPVDTVAKMFCDFTGDSCACDFNGNDEWLSEVCELQDECPYPKDRFGCWKQYIKHYVERKE